MKRRAAVGALVICAGLTGLAASRLASPEPVLPQHRFSANEMVAAGSDPIRIVAMGTSLTRNSRWPDDLAKELARCAGRQIEITRIAEAGANSAWGMGQAQAAAALLPDLVLIEFAINDADIRDGQSLGGALKAHRALLDAMAEASPGSRPILMTTNRAFGMRGLLRPALGAHYAQYRQLAADTDIGLIDLAPVWAAALGSASDRNALVPDGLHPTEAAVAEIALPVLVDEVGRRVSGCG